MSDGRPVVGITTSFPHTERGDEAVAPYAAAVALAGGEPVVLSNEANAIAVVLARCSALLFSGGGDVAVTRYGGTPHPAAKPAPAERDDFEIELVRAARERGVPTLCICRGMQVASVAFGGALIEHVPDALGTQHAIEHEQLDETGLERDDYAPGHVVTLDAAGALARRLGRTSFETNSMHHQAVDPGRLGEGFRVGGTTPDGIVEALEPAFQHPYFVAVQWHPEELWSAERERLDPVAIALFTGLVRAAAGVRPK